MATLERAIYSIAYYWHGISKHGILGVLWLYDKIHHLELLSWSNVGNLPYNQVVVNKINEMIVNGNLRVTDRWIPKFGILGLEPIYSNNSRKVFKLLDRFSEKRFRMAIRYYLDHPKKFKILYNNRQDKSIPRRTFYNRVSDWIIEDSRVIK